MPLMFFSFFTLQFWNLELRAKVFRDPCFRRCGILFFSFPLGQSKWPRTAVDLVVSFFFLLFCACEKKIKRENGKDKYR